MTETTIESNISSLRDLSRIYNEEIKVKRMNPVGSFSVLQYSIENGISKDFARKHVILLHKKNLIEKLPELGVCGCSLYRIKERA